MQSDLRTKLEAILIEKEKLHPEYLREGVTIFDITGTYTPQDAGFIITDAGSLFHRGARYKDRALWLSLCKDVTNMEFMFCDLEMTCDDTVIDLSTFIDTSKVISMRAMFQSCGLVTDIDLSSFDTSNVEDASYMFVNSTELVNINLSSFKMPKLTQTTNMFYACSKLSDTTLQQIAAMCRTMTSHPTKSLKDIGISTQAQANKIISYGIPGWKTGY